MQPNRSPSPQAGKPTSGSVDFWDVGNANFAGNQLPQDAEFSELVGVRTAGADGKAKALGWVFLILILGVGGYGAYVYFVEGQNPIDQITAFIDSHFGDGSPEDAQLPPGPTAPPPKADPTATAPARGKPADHVAGNPYWSLPNKILGAPPAPARMWSAEEEETWRAQLAHRYSYQRWKTVMDIRRRKLKGSDAVLWDALQDKKFWTRMYAAVGLAELDVEVSLNSLEGAIGDARSELVADFFERFVRRPNAGQAFVMRQVVRLLDEKGRLVVLNGIDRSRDDMRDLYLVAATLDPGRRVQRWIGKRLARSPIPKERFQRLLDVVEGKVTGEEYLAGRAGTGTAPGKGKGKGKGKGGDGAMRLATGKDVDEGLTDDVGDIEFFEEEAPAVKDASDAETFDYEYEE